MTIIACPGSSWKWRKTTDIASHRGVDCLHHLQHYGDAEVLQVRHLVCTTTTLLGVWGCSNAGIWRGSEVMQIRAGPQLTLPN
jgi:hypothetical protein